MTNSTVKKPSLGLHFCQEILLSLLVYLLFFYVCDVLCLPLCAYTQQHLRGIGVAIPKELDFGKRESNKLLKKLSV